MNKTWNAEDFAKAFENLANRGAWGELTEKGEEVFKIKKTPKKNDGKSWICVKCGLGKNPTAGAVYTINYQINSYNLGNYNYCQGCMYEKEEHLHSRCNNCGYDELLWCRDKVENIDICKTLDNLVVV